MGIEQDRLLLIRSELVDQLEALALTYFDANPVQFLIRLDNLRSDAQSYRYDAVAEIASAFEAAIQRNLSNCSVNHLIENYMAALREAIGANRMDAGIANSLLANVALRLHS